MTLLEPPGQVEPSLPLWFTAAALVLVGIGATLKIPGYWRGNDSSRRSREAFGFFGDAAGRALASVVPLAAPASIVFGVLGLALLTREVSTGPIQQVAEMIGTLLVVPTLLLIALAFEVILFGRPRALIPPRLRGQSGLLGALVSAVSPRGRRREPPD